PKQMIRSFPSSGGTGRCSDPAAEEAPAMPLGPRAASERPAVKPAANPMKKRVQRFMVVSPDTQAHCQRGPLGGRLYQLLREGLIISKDPRTTGDHTATHDPLCL